MAPQDKKTVVSTSINSVSYADIVPQGTRQAVRIGITFNDGTALETAIRDFQEFLKDEKSPENQTPLVRKVEEVRNARQGNKVTFEIQVDKEKSWQEVILPVLEKLGYDLSAQAQNAVQAERERLMVKEEKGEFRPVDGGGNKINRYMRLAEGLGINELKPAGAVTFDAQSIYVPLTVNGITIQDVIPNENKTLHRNWGADGKELSTGEYSKKFARPVELLPKLVFHVGTELDAEKTGIVERDHFKHSTQYYIVGKENGEGTFALIENPSLAQQKEATLVYKLFDRSRGEWWVDKDKRSDDIIHLDSSRDVSMDDKKTHPVALKKGSVVKVDDYYDAELRQEGGKVSVITAHYPENYMVYNPASADPGSFVRVLSQKLVDAGIKPVKVYHFPEKRTLVVFAPGGDYESYKEKLEHAIGEETVVRRGNFPVKDLIRDKATEVVSQWDSNGLSAANYPVGLSSDGRYKHPARAEEGDGKNPKQKGPLLAITNPLRQLDPVTVDFDQDVSGQIKKVPLGDGFDIKTESGETISKMTIRFSDKKFGEALYLLRNNPLSTPAGEQFVISGERIVALKVGKMTSPDDPASEFVRDLRISTNADQSEIVIEGKASPKYYEMLLKSAVRVSSLDPFQPRQSANIAIEIQTDRATSSQNMQFTVGGKYPPNINQNNITNLTQQTIDDLVLYGLTKELETPLRNADPKKSPSGLEGYGHYKEAAKALRSDANLVANINAHIAGAIQQYYPSFYASTQTGNPPANTLPTVTNSEVTAMLSRLDKTMEKVNKVRLEFSEGTSPVKSLEQPGIQFVFDNAWGDASLTWQKLMDKVAKDQPTYTNQDYPRQVGAATDQLGGITGLFSKLLPDDDLQLSEIRSLFGSVNNRAASNLAGAERAYQQAQGQNQQQNDQLRQQYEKEKNEYETKLREEMRKSKNKPFFSLLEEKSEDLLSDALKLFANLDKNGVVPGHVGGNTSLPFAPGKIELS